MKYQLQYHVFVVERDIPRLSKNIAERIRKNIENKLMIEPDKFGKPLRRSLKGYRKLRVGDYRVIFRISGTIVKIFAIQHRSIVYKDFLNQN